MTDERNARVSDVSGLNNRLTVSESNYTLKVGATRTDGKKVLAGIGLASQAVGDLSQSEVLIQADKLVFVPSSDPNAPLTNLFVLANINGVNTLQIPSALIGSINAGQINTGSLRGISVASGSYLTRGSTLTTAYTNTDTVINLESTVDFAGSGTAIINGLDGTGRRNERRATYTGKTATQLTGVTNTLVTNAAVGTIVVPGQGGGSIVGDQLTNELRIYGDQNRDGVISRLVSIGADGTNFDQWIMEIGTSGFPNSLGGLLIQSQVSQALNVYSSQNSAITAFSDAVGGFGVRIGDGTQSRQMTPLRIDGSTTNGHMFLLPLSNLPAITLLDNGRMVMANTTGGTVGNRTATPRLLFAEGAQWKLVGTNTVFAG